MKLLSVVLNDEYCSEQAAESYKCMIPFFIKVIIKNIILEMNLYESFRKSKRVIYIRI